MPVVMEVLGEDFQAAKLSFEKDDYSLMNIYANRLASNAFLGDVSWAASIGHFLKQIAVDALNARQRTDALNAVKAAGRKLLDALEPQLSNEGDALKRWHAYLEYTDKARLGFLNDVEKEVYEEHPEYTTRISQVLARILRSEQNLLLDPKNVFLTGILNELDRTQRVHGMTPKTLAFRALIRALMRYYDYVVFASLLPDGTVDEKLLTGELGEIVNDVADVMDIPDVDDKQIIGKTEELLSKIVFGWRRFFIYYMERTLSTRSLGEQRRIELPEESKQKISEIIEKSLEREVKGT